MNLYQVKHRQFKTFINSLDQIQNMNKELQRMLGKLMELDRMLDKITAGLVHEFEQFKQEEKRCPDGKTREEVELERRMKLKEKPDEGGT